MELDRRPQITPLAAKVMYNENLRYKITRKTCGKYFKLSPEQVRAIRSMAGSDRELAKKFGVTKLWISLIRSGKARTSVK